MEVGAEVAIYAINSKFGYQNIIIIAENKEKYHKCKKLRKAQKCSDKLRKAQKCSEKKKYNKIAIKTKEYPANPGKYQSYGFFL